MNYLSSPSSAGVVRTLAGGISRQVPEEIRYEISSGSVFSQGWFAVVTGFLLLNAACSERASAQNSQHLPGLQPPAGRRSSSQSQGPTTICRPELERERPGHHTVESNVDDHTGGRDHGTAAGTVRHQPVQSRLRADTSNACGCLQSRVTCQALRVSARVLGWSPEARIYPHDQRHQFHLELSRSVEWIEIRPTSFTSATRLTAAIWRAATSPSLEQPPCRW